MNGSKGFATPDMTGGSLWFETPQTEAAMVRLFSLLDVARDDAVTWQPFWVLAGGAGVGKTALALRFATQAHRSSSCDAVRAAEEAYAKELRTPKIPSPDAFAKRRTAWDAYRAFEAMSPAERVARFGDCPHACRPADVLPEEVFEQALDRARDARPVMLGDLSLTDTDIASAFSRQFWSSVGNRLNDPIRRTSLVFVDGADRLVRLGVRKRAQMLDEMLDWPRVGGSAHRVTFVLIGKPALADAVAECGDVGRIDLPAMPDEGPDGTFGLLCDRIFGTREAADVKRLHQASGGIMGRLLTIARLQGLQPPFGIPDGEIRRLPPP